MRKYKIWVIIYSLLSSFVSGSLLLLMVFITLIPIVRRYTIINKTDQELYVTPLIQFGGNGYVYDELYQDETGRRQYIEEVENFSILDQYCFYSVPAIPALNIKDIRVSPHSKKVLFIDYDNLKQEFGPQVLLIKNSKDEYFYLEADFWSRTEVAALSSLDKATDNLIDAKNSNDKTSRQWLFLFVALLLIITFPYLLIRSLSKYRAIKKQHIKI